MKENPDHAPGLLYSLTLENEAATKHLAERLGKLLVAGDVICLWGELGVGKSSFARALIQFRQKQAYPKKTHPKQVDQVPSPTFTLVQSYATDREDIHHYDLYRLQDENEIPELGIDEAFSEGIALIEWPDRLGRYLPRDRLDILLAHIEQDPDRRRIEIHATHARWVDKLAGLAD